MQITECEKQPEMSDDVMVVTLTVLPSVTCTGESSSEFYGFIYEQEAVKLKGAIKILELGTLSDIHLQRCVQQTDRP